ncbi:MAG: GNAT family N-acetyltransferase [Sphingobacteriaceae bacterium]|nr:GNAT family N-acetyltransferase [Cytophagaceae bacterium]
MREAFGADNTEENLSTYLDSAFTVEKLRDELRDARVTFFLAKQGDEVLGYATLNRHRRKPNRLRGKRAVELQRIYVLQYAQGLGLGRFLMETCLNTARTEGYETVFLGVWEKNYRAQAFYSTLGFHRCGWHYFQFGSDRQRDYWMNIEL